MRNPRTIWQAFPPAVKAVAAAAAVILLILLLARGWDWLQDWRFERSQATASKEVQAAKAEAAKYKAEAEANAKLALEKDRLYQEASRRAEQAEAARDAAMQVRLKAEASYQRIRTAPIDTTKPVSLDETCRKLAEVGRPCEP